MRDLGFKMLCHGVNHTEREPGLQEFDIWGFSPVRCLADLAANYRPSRHLGATSRATKWRTRSSVNGAASLSPAHRAGDDERTNALFHSAPKWRDSGADIDSIAWRRWRDSVGSSYHTPQPPPVCLNGLLQQTHASGLTSVATVTEPVNCRSCGRKSAGLIMRLCRNFQRTDVRCYRPGFGGLTSAATVTELPHRDDVLAQ